MISITTSHLPSFCVWRTHYLACKSRCCSDMPFHFLVHERYELMAMEAEYTPKEIWVRELMWNKMLDCLLRLKSFDKIHNSCNGCYIKLIKHPADLVSVTSRQQRQHQQVFRYSNTLQSIPTSKAWKSAQCSHLNLAAAWWAWCFLLLQLTTWDDIAAARCTN